jgi:3,4-dihydroxy 2-butanone 4-phosphate synthase/GTP cyclohydrolase II
MSFEDVEEALKALGKGAMVVVTGIDDVESDGGIILAAQHASLEHLAFLGRHGEGAVSVALRGERMDHLGLPAVPDRRAASRRGAGSISVAYRPEASGGADQPLEGRLATLHALVDPETLADDFEWPGSVVVQRSVPGGVLGRPGHAEAAVDLTTLAGLRPGGVMAKVKNVEGRWVQGDEWTQFASAHGMPVVSIVDLVAYRRKNTQVQRDAEAWVPTLHGNFRACTYSSPDSPVEQFAMVLGEVKGEPDVLVRVHSECLTGDTFGSLRCDCRPQLEASLAAVGNAGRGVVLYLRGHEGRGIGLTHKLRAYALQDQGFDTVDANLELGLSVDARDFAVAAAILRDLGIASIRLLTNNPAKYQCIAGLGPAVVEQVPLRTVPTKENEAYLRTKQARLHHLLAMPPAA